METQKEPTNSSKRSWWKQPWWKHPYFFAGCGVGIVLEASRRLSSDMFTNLLAEFVGWAFGVCIAAALAFQVARRRADLWARVVVKLVAQLRRDQTISQIAARRAVVCAANLISNDLSRDLRGTGGLDGDRTTCSVCALPARTTELKGLICCKYCHLPGEVWQDLRDDIDEDQAALVDKRVEHL